ncbi:MAG TPA: cupin domain-containing protein [Vicinamibacterales bacterium]|jgi:quercetin dioxygenase-like cupin family protein|nr:cupin domain-containing protein [Vicinamibacterales bacterium]
MRRAVLVAAAVAMGVSAGALRAQETPRLPDPAGQDRIVPVYEEPRHRQIFKSGTTRILELIVLPGDTSLFHSHEDPIAYINLSGSTLRTQELGKEWSQGGGRGGARAGGPAAPVPAAEAPAVRVTSTTSYTQTPATHRIANTGTGIVHALVVVNQTKGTDATTPKDAGFEGTPELTNSWFRAYRFSLPPGQSGTHTHKAPAFLVQTSAGTAVTQGGRLRALNDVGDWAFFDAGVAHEMRNTGTATVEFVEVEVRQPR